MRTVHTSMTSTFQKNKNKRLNCFTEYSVALASTSHGGMYRQNSEFCHADFWPVRRLASP